MYLNFKKCGTNFLNISNAKEDRDYLERFDNDNPKKPDSIKILNDKLKGITKKVNFQSKSPPLDFLSKMINNQREKGHEKKNSCVYNFREKEEAEIDKNVIDIIKYKKQRSSHSGPKNSKQESRNLNFSKEESQEKTKKKNLSLIKSKINEAEFESSAIKDLKIKYFSTKNEKAKKIVIGAQNDFTINIENNLFKKANDMKKIYQMNEKKENDSNKFTLKENKKMKELFMQNLKIHNEEDIRNTISGKHNGLEIKTSKDQKIFEFPKYLQNYTCTTKEKTATPQTYEKKDKLTEYKEFLKAKMKQINEKMETQMKEVPEENVPNTFPTLETENSFKVFNNIKYRMNPKPNQADHDKPIDKTSKFKEEYIVGKEIGQGAYATVRIAIHKATKTRVAIKIYEKFKIMDPQRKKSVKREIKLLKMMSHPYIIKLHETFETNHHINIIMEYVGGPSLYTYLKSQPNKKLNEPEAKRIFRQITEALHYCHKKCITHRDIKLENLLMDEEKNIKLIDFGFSTCMSNDQKSKMFCGTPSYMSPEIVLKKEYCGPPADIWALGVLLFALLFGYFPYKGTSDHELYSKISTADYIIPEYISKEAKNLLQIIFVIHCDQRPTAEEILNHDWLCESDELIFNSKKETGVINMETYLFKTNLNEKKAKYVEKEKPIKNAKIIQKNERESTPDEQVFYTPNTFYVNAKNLYINVNEAPVREEGPKPKQRTCLQNKHSLLINNMNYKKLNISANTTKHKRNFTENLQIDPDFTYINNTDEIHKELFEDLPSGQKKCNQTIFPSNVPSMMTLNNSNTSRSPSSYSNTNQKTNLMTQKLIDKSIKNLDRSKIFLNQNPINTSFVFGENTKKINKTNHEDFISHNNKNIYENAGYMNYLTENKEEFNSILHLK